MDGLKKVVAVFALTVAVVAFIAPAMAQSYGGGYAQPAYQGGAQPAYQPAYQGGAQPAYQGGEQQGQTGEAGQGQTGQAGQGQTGQAGQGQQGGLKESNKDLMQTIDDAQDTSIFAAAVKAAGYDKVLSEKEGPYMIFAPSDKALQDAGVTDISSLDDKTIKSIVENGIVSKVSEPQQGSNSFTMTSIGGQKITAKKAGNSITVNGIKVDNVIKANNGMLIVTEGIVGPE